MSDLSLAITFKVVDQASKQFQQLDAEFNKLTSKWEKLGFAVGSALKVGTATAVGALAVLTKAAIDNADAMQDAANRVGVSVESFSALAYAAKLSGSNAQELEAGLAQLNKSIAESQDKTSGAADAFKYLGVQTKNADGSLRNADEVFKDVADSIAKLPDGANKAAVVTELFSKAGGKLIDTLNNGSAGLEEFRKEAEALGLVISAETAKAAGDFNDSIDRIGNSIMGAATNIATQLTPTLNLLASEFVKTIKEGEGFKSFAEGVGIVFRTVIKIISTAVSTVYAFGKGIGALGAAVAAVASGDFKGAVNILKMYKDDVDAINTANEEFKKKVDDTGTAQAKATEETKKGTTARENFVASSKKAAAAAEAENKAFEKLKKSLLDQISGFKELSAEEQTLQLIQEKAAGTRSKANQEELLALARRADATKQLRLYQDQYVQSLLGTQTTLAGIQRTYDDLSTIERNLSGQHGFGWSSVGSAKSIIDITNALRGQEDAIQDMQRELDILNSSDELRKLNTNKILELETRIKAAKAAQAAVTQEQKDDAQQQLILNELITRNLAVWSEYIGNAADEQARLEATGNLLTKWLAEGKITLDQYNIAVTKLNENVANFNNSTLTKTQQKVREIATEFQTSFENFFYNIMQGQFDNILKSFKQLLDRMVAQALAANLANALFGNSFTKGGAVGGWAGSALTGLASIFGFRANGGPVTAGQPYIVGERRAEVFVPNRNGTILPSTDSLASMNAGATQVNFNVQAIDSASFLTHIDKNKRALTQLVQGTQRTYNMRTA